MICEKCGYDSDLRVLKSYTIILDDIELPSLNTVGTNNGRKKYKYRNWRRDWNKLLQKYVGKIPKATGHRHVTIIRARGKGKRAYDYGNLVGGAKPLLDMLVANGFLLDDNPKVCSEYYHDIKSNDGVPSVTILLEETE